MSQIEHFAFELTGWQALLAVTGVMLTSAAVTMAVIWTVDTLTARRRR